MILNKTKYYIKERSGSNDRRYYYVDVGSEAHGRPSFRLWIAAGIAAAAERDENGRKYISFPAMFDILVTEKGTNVLVPTDLNNVVYDIFCCSGFRGQSEIEVEGYASAIPYAVWNSPRGRLGISSGAIVVAPGPIVVRWRRTGRLYGAEESGSMKVLPDGSEVELVDDELELIKA